MKNYNLTNNILGWLTFVIAAVVYLLTMEPTASFWDCGEFIATAYKLEIGHPPGAPIFMLVGRLFTLFAGSPEYVAVTVNALSALCSAFTILFLFWTITHLSKKLIAKKGEELSLGKTIAIMGSGLVGALAYTFSDSFWFSAVEGEVYAFSSFFTAIVFWAILKWENEADKPHANRWLILIAYLMGLSIGVHLLNLLAIPAIVLVYYYKKYTPTPKGTVLALLASVGILVFVMYGIIPGVVKLAAMFELLFVNGIGLPFNSGILIYVALLIGLVVWGIRYTSKKGKVLWNTVVVMVTVILIGYSSFATILIRSSVNPPMDENSPDHAFSLLSYLNREQYGDRPLLYGQNFNAPITDFKETNPVRAKHGDKYEIVNHKVEYEFDKRMEDIFPRMWSTNNPRHAQEYKRWSKMKGVKVGKDAQGKPLVKPTFAENMRYMFSYQLGHMYWRYFMWNFSGRQNDIQGHGDILNGNWLSGISFIDNARLGDQSDLPSSMKDNKGRNIYFMLPLLLGLLGIVYQLFFKGDKGYRSFLLVGILFVMTGIAIVIYLNQYPLQPRERDYAFAGSFYAFAIWIGFGVLMVYELLRKLFSGNISAAIATVLCLVLVPGIMANENWDDHDRSGRYMCRDFATNYLNSCEKNGVIFTNGDNDTFPLWYAQEVEGIRTDLRVCNLSYLQTDWYIEQMRRKAYESEPLEYTLTADKTITGKSEIVYMIDQVGGKSVDFDQALKYLASDNPQTKQLRGYNKKQIEHFPAKNFYIPVDSAKAVASGAVPKGYENRIVDSLKLSFKKQSMRKNELMVLDLLSTSKWERPIYYAYTVPSDSYANLSNYFHFEGLAYRIRPIKMDTKNNVPGEHGQINTERMYDLMVNKFVWGGSDTPGIYLDDNTMRMCTNYRQLFIRLASALVGEGKIDKAQKTLKRCMEVLPESNIPYDVSSVFFVDALFQANLTTEATEVASKLVDILGDNFNWYIKLDKSKQATIQQTLYRDLRGIHQLRQISNAYKANDVVAKCDKLLNGLTN